VKNLFENPLVVKQMREEMRSRKIFFLVPVYIAILSVIALVAVGSTSSSSSFNPVALSSNAKVTLFSFIIAVSILLGLISLILGAASFTTEKERSTFELLELTPLSYIQLVLGKFLHSFILITLILFSSLPVFSTLFFMGGLTYSDLILPILYLVLFFAVIILGAICISIGANRTIVSIILSLLLGFVSYILLAILGTSAFREPADIGFALLSPWLVTWRQIFQPVPLKLGTLDVPVWTAYTLLYGLIAGLFLAWGHNALDTRKLQRNRRARIVGLILINVYAAFGILCTAAYRRVTAKNIDELYQILLIVLMAVLPFFVMGVFTEKDEQKFRERPLLQTFHPGNLFLNHPATGPFYLIVLLATITVTVALCTGHSLRLLSGALFILLVWIFPWILFFIALRLYGVQARGIFVSYLLAMLIIILAATFYHSGKSVGSPFDFFLVIPVLVSLYAFALVAFIVGSLRSAKRLRRTA
jgi:hypothetical protein